MAEDDPIDPAKREAGALLRRVLDYYAVSKADQEIQRRSASPLLYTTIANALLAVVWVACIAAASLETREFELWGVLLWPSIICFLAAIWRLVADWHLPICGYRRTTAVWRLLLWLFLFAMWYCEFAGAGK